MKTKILTPVNMLLMMLLGVVLAMPVAVEAGRGHHRFGHGHHKHHYNHGYRNSHHRHYNRGHRHSHHRHHKRHYYNRHNQYYGGYNRAYYPPRRYYNRPYYNQPYYNPQPGYGYGPNYINYPPAVGYGYPHHMSLGVHTGNARFMLRY